MKVELNDGIVVECTTEELMELKEKGFLGRKETPNLLTEPKTVKHKKQAFYKRFTKRENGIIKDVWEHRKNMIRLTKREYKLLEKEIPGHNRKAISSRIGKMKKIGLLK